MTKDTAGANGIDPTRQGITTSIAVPVGQWRSIESLANRADAIRPHEILRFQSQLQSSTTLWVASQLSLLTLTSVIPE